MAATFALTAIPHLFREGDHKGHLEYVTLIATDGDDVHEWSSFNVGTLIQDLAMVVDAATALSIMQRLHRDETVLFPGLFEIEVLHSFGGQCSE